MDLTKAQKKIQDRRSIVYKEYLSENGDSVQQVVDKLAKRFKVSTVTVYSDIKIMKGISNA